MVTPLHRPPGSRPIAIAHRAGNHLDSLKLAETANMDLIEADIWHYQGRIEIRHLKTIGPLPVLWDRWELRSGTGPRLLLPELLRAASPSTTLMLDLKGQNPRLAQAVADACEREMAGRPVVICARHWPLLEPFAGNPLVTPVHSVGNRRQLAAVLARLDQHPQPAVSIHERLLTPESVDLLKQLGAAIVTWPINTADGLARMTALDVDGVISDELPLLEDVVATRL